MINFVIYSHTDYLDVLEIQTDYLKSEENKILLINKSDWNPIYSKFKEVIFYDDSLPYAGRVLSLSKLSSEVEHIFICQDKDIIIKKNNDIINAYYEKMLEYNIDRVDLRYDAYPHHELEMIQVNNEFSLSRQIDGSSLFNIGPSIWKLSSYLNLMNTFKNSSYRQIEFDAQEYCKTNYVVYKNFSNERLNSGLTICTKAFQYMSITHVGKFLPKDRNVLRIGDRGGNRMDDFFIEEWLRIIDKFCLAEKQRLFSDVYDIRCL